MTLNYLGDEDIEVEAGSFRARHLPEEHPPYDVWCTADDDYIFLKAGVGGYMQTHCELVSLDID